MPEAASVSVADCFTISNLVTQGYLSGQYDEVSVVYTRFVSMLTQTPAQDSLLPLEKLEAKDETGVRQLVLYEPSPSAVYDAIVPNYIAGMIYGAMSNPSPASWALAERQWTPPARMHRK